METNYLGCLIGLIISLYLSTIESLDERDATVITYVGWAIYILFAKGAPKWHLYH